MADRMMQCEPVTDQWHSSHRLLRIALYWCAGLVLGVAAVLIALGIAIGAAWAQSGDWGDGHAEMHPVYQGWRDNRGYSCCNDRDCRPTRVCDLGGQLGVIADGKCVFVPPEAVLHIPSPDGRSHVCMSKGALQPMCVVIGEPRG